MQQAIGLHGLTTMRNTEKIRQLEQEIATFKMNNGDLHGQLAAAGEKYDRLNIEQQILSAENRDQFALITRLQNETRELTAENRRLAAEVAELNRHSVALTTKMETVRQTVVGFAQQLGLDHKTNTFDTLTSIIQHSDALNNSITQIGQSAVDSKTLVGELQQRLEQAEQLMTARIADLTAKHDAANKQNAIAKTISRNGGTVVICAEVCPYDRATFEAILAKWQPESIDA
jgi:chromosome segregation ATPase